VLLAFAEEQERDVEKHHEQHKGATDKSDPCHGVPRLREGKDDKDRRHGSCKGEVVEGHDGVRLRREAEQKPLFRLPIPPTPPSFVREKVTREQSEEHCSASADLRPGG
jgi:hypothetical protein